MIDRILGPEAAAILLRRLAADTARLDHLTEDQALRAVCERAADGDPLLLAAPGQTWTARPDIPTDDIPARTLHVVGRLADPPRVVVADADLPDPDHTELIALPVTALTPYELTAWQPELETTPGGTP